MSKIRKTQLSFTLSDTQLSEQIDRFSEGENDTLSVEKIEGLESKGNVLLSKIRDSINEVLMEDFDEEKAELNQKIKETCFLFVKYFENPENQVAQFQVATYLYRDKIFDQVLDDFSIFVTLLLKKITAYKTYVFIKYYEQSLEEHIRQSLDESSTIIKGALQSKDLAADYKKSFEINKQAKMAINFVKSKLTKKKTDTETFNNIFLNKEIPKIINNVNLNYERKADLNTEELEIIDKSKESF